MDYRNYSWADSITTILKKTECNLLRSPTSAHTNPTDRKNSSMNFRSNLTESYFKEQKSSSIDPEDYSTTSYNFQQFKNSVFEKLLSQQKDIEKLKAKTTYLENSGTDIMIVKEDFDMALAAVEKRCLNEVRRVESMQKSYVTLENLKLSEESIKNDITVQLGQVDQSYRDLRSTYYNLPNIISKETEECLKGKCKKFITFDDLKKIKEIIFKENERVVQELNENCMKLEKMLIESIEKAQENSNRIASQFEKTLKGVRDNMNTCDLKNERKFLGYEQNLSSLSQKFAFDLNSLEKVYKDELNRLDFTEEIEAVKRKEKEAQKSHEQLINKLIQLEQRVSLLEEASESESVNEVFPIKKCLESSNSVVSTKKSLEMLNSVVPAKKSLDPLNSVVSDLGSRETEYTKNKSQSVKNIEQNLLNDNFIWQVTEEFIEDNINFAIGIIKKPKVQIPKLNFPVISSETPPVSRDDLNNAVILNSDFTGKSESPFDLSKI
ncbi:hypothetical protein SteCoe_17795 [Stentor coeruleus]|uniref:Uncharacterized protein n=1 Tax=Stentor coeruleus TaxID=5963 RepID=A0A1R2BY19_9CILI|nr:hypothetical protein SteCoe_17795 [Stentor coeruleus]